MTWEMYERLYQTCEEVDGDDSIRVLVLKGAGGKAFVAGTDIGQFTGFEERRRRSALRARGRSPHVSRRPGHQARDRADRGLRRRRRPRHRRRRRPSRRDARIALRRADRAHARQLPSMQAYARYLDLSGHRG